MHIDTQKKLPDDQTAVNSLEAQVVFESTAKEVPGLGSKFKRLSQDAYLHLRRHLEEVRGEHPIVRYI